MLTQRVGKYRHVMFADALNGSGRAVNLGPDQWEAEPDRASEQALSPDENSFVHWLMRRVDLDSNNYRGETLHRRLQACLRSCRAGSVQHAKAIIRRQPELVGPALGALLIGVTSFFRDASVFDYLAQRVLPELLARRPVLRVWSVACSDGAELYSIAMLLAEMNALRRGVLLGTDCRHDATQNAQAGVYESSAVQSLPPGMSEKYFTSHPPNWRVNEPLRRSCHWRRGDMLSMTEPGQWDLILCRNVTMYLKPQAAAGLWEKLIAALSNGGVLVTGKAERPPGGAPLQGIAPCIYRRARS